MSIGARVRGGVVCAAAVLSATPWAMGGNIPCQACGPGNHWVDACPKGIDTLNNSSAIVGIDLDLDGDLDANLIISGPTTIWRSAGVPHRIDTEIVSMVLTGGGVTLTAGAGLGMGGVLPPSLGEIVEQPSNPASADSSFEVFFEVDLGGGQFLYNHTAATLEAKINCVPPDTTYFHVTVPVELFTAPAGGVHVADLVSANHRTFPPQKLPAVSTWGLIVLGLLVLIGAKTFFGRRRATQALESE